MSANPLPCKFSQPLGSESLVLMPLILSVILRGCIPGIPGYDIETRVLWGIGFYMKKSVTLTIDEDLWERCQRLRRTAGANWSQIAELAFYSVVETFDKLSVPRDETLPSSGNTDAFAEDALLHLESQYKVAIQKTNQALSGINPADLS